jgi:hypothetical protein
MDVFLEERILLGSVARKYLNYLVTIHTGASTLRGRSRSGTSEILAGCKKILLYLNNYLKLIAAFPEIRYYLAVLYMMERIV